MYLCSENNESFISVSVFVTSITSIGSPMNGTNGTNSLNWMEQRDDLLGHYYYKKAKDVIKTDEDKALSFLYAELAQCRENGYAHLAMADLYLKQGQYGLAMTSAVNAIQYLHYDKESLAMAYNVQGYIFFYWNELDKAVESLDISIACFPDAVVYANRAFCYYKLEDYEKSNADYLRAAELDPTDYSNYYHLGRNEFDLDNYAQACSWYEHCLKLNPTYVPALGQLAWCKWFLDDFAGCIDACLECLKLDGGNQSVKQLLYEALEHKNYPILESKLLDLVSQEPKEWIWADHLAFLYYKWRKHYQSIRWYLEGQEQIPSYSYDMIAQNCLELGNYKMAERFAKRALEADPEYYGAHRTLAGVYYSQFRLNDAMSELKWCNKVKPDDTGVLRMMSDMSRMQKRFYDATRYAKAAVKLEPRNSGCLLTLSYAYEMRGDSAEQLKCMDRIIDLWYDAEWDDRAEAYAVLGNADAAKYYIDYALKNNRDAYNYDYICVGKAFILTKLDLLDEAREALEFALKEGGFRNFDMLLHMDIWQCMRRIPGYVELIEQYRRQAQEEFEKECRNAGIWSFIQQFN